MSSASILQTPVPPAPFTHALNFQKQLIVVVFFYEMVVWHPRHFVENYICRKCPHAQTFEALPGVLGIQGEGLFIIRDLGRRVIYFKEFGEKA